MRRFLFCDSLKYMRLLKGKKIADKILADLKRAVKKQKSKPGLAVILVGENKASKVYVGLKKKAAKAVGINFYLHKFSEKEKEEAVIGKIKELNEDKKINGIIVQLPLPKKFKTQKIIDAISPEKDADGFHPENIRKYLRGGKVPMPVFPRAIARLLESTRLNFKNKKGVMIANSAIFGKVMKFSLGKKGIKTQIILKQILSKFDFDKIKKADVLITAVGKQKLINGDMVKKNVVIIDGGIIKKGKKVLGDVDFESVKNKVSYIAPVPGGVGPVTIACLLENVYQLHAAFLESKKSR